MICKQCKKEGKKSKVYIGASTMTCVNFGNGHYNEEGIYVEPADHNSHTTQYSCSNGHSFKIDSKMCVGETEFRQGYKRFKGSFRMDLL